MIASEPIRRVPTDEIDVIAALRVLSTYKYLIAAVAAICALVALYLALTATHIYQAQITINQVREDSLSGSRLLSGTLGGLANLAGLSGITGGGAALEDQAVLESHRLASEFISRHELIDELANASGQATLWFAVREFRESVLSIEQDETTGIIKVSIDWPDPVTASRWANGYVALANDLIRERALRESSRNIAYLNEQLSHTSSLELQRVMYNLIESETKTQMLANGRAEYAFTVVDPAVVPEMRIKPRRTLMVLTGTGLGVVLGILLAFALNVRRRYREESRAP